MSIGKMPLSTEIPWWSSSHLNVSVWIHSYELWATDQHLLQVPEHFFLLLLLPRKPVPAGRLLFSAWISTWLDIARWTGQRADGLRLHVGLSARFISSHGFSGNPFKSVHLPVSIMKRASYAARYRQAKATQTTPSSRFVHLQLLPSSDA